MTRKLFGTDGVRGRANTFPMTAEMALKLGAAAGRFFRRDGSPGHRVVIGKDTRLSGYMLENALTAGLCSTGMNVLLLGPVPTPAVGFLTRSMRADLGVMISASHNRHQDNGIKFFGPDGYKLSDEAEAEAAGIAPKNIAIDPGIGFGKTLSDNLTLLARLSLFHGLGVPVLLGASRKRFIGTVASEQDAARRLPGSLAVALQGVAQGMQMIRVHDVAETRQALSLWQAATTGEPR